MQISLVVATDLDGVIGLENRLPWHLPADLQHFKRVTMGKPILMGRRTWESIGRALPGRASIVLTRQEDFAPSACLVARSVEEALALAQRTLAAPAWSSPPPAGPEAMPGRSAPEPAGPGAARSDEVMVIGGATTFAAFLPLATRLYWTQVQAHVGGDTRFPPLVLAEWQEVERTDRPADAQNPYALRFLLLARRSAS